MFGMLGNSAMFSPAVVKQALMASGVKDPRIMRLAEKLCGKLGKPCISVYEGPAFPIPLDCEPILIKSETPEDDVYLLVYTRKKPEKGVDGGK